MAGGLGEMCCHLTVSVLYTPNAQMSCSCGLYIRKHQHAGRLLQRHVETPQVSHEES
jgi:hypothetical protein